jgi:hypothetical protein
MFAQRGHVYTTVGNLVQVRPAFKSSGVCSQAMAMTEPLKSSNVGCTPRAWTRTGIRPTVQPSSGPGQKM